VKFEILHKGKLLEVKEFVDGTFKIGRVAESDIQLTSPGISKAHATLVVRAGRAAVIDMGSSNGTFVNGILVKKHRIEMGDEITIGEYKIRLARNQRVAVGKPRAVGGGVDGNAALSYESSAEPEPAAPPTPQEKLVLLMDKKVLIPFYQILRTVDWKWILGSIILGALLCSVSLSVLPFVRWGQQITSQEALNRAHTLLAQVVRENYRIISKTNDFTRLTVESAENEKGILAIFVVDPKSNIILAPAKFFNKSVTEPYTLLAIKQIQEGKEDRVSVSQEGDEYVVAQPIYIFSSDTNDRSLAAIVLAYFRVDQGVSSTFTPITEAAIFSIFLSLLAFYFITKMVTYPLATLQEQLDAALKGENVTITAEARLPELETLATVMNFSISRMRQAGGGAAPVQTSEAEEIAKTYELAVQEFDAGTSDALLLLDQDNKIRFVGKILEDLIGLRNQYAMGQNISDACRDQSFAGTAIDLSDRVKQTIGQMQTATLDVNGISRSLVAVAHRNAAGEIAWVLITVKMTA
jgi:hypothetical protein